MMWPADLAAIARECRAAVLRHPARGFTASDLATWVADFRPLSTDDREWVQIEMVKMRELAVTFGRYGAAHFYGREVAPAGAFHFEPKREHGEIIERAGTLG